jgi:hypothetical protein
MAQKKIALTLFALSFAFLVFIITVVHMDNESHRSQIYERYCAALVASHASQTQEFAARCRG